jgi:heptosyltransferase-2
LERVLVIQTASLGDVILATPVIEKIHHFYPETRIDFLLKKGYEDLFQSHPFLHQLILWDKSENKLGELNRLAQVIRSHRYDLVINVQRFASSGFLTVFSGAKRTIGFNKNPFSIFFHKSIKHKIGKGKNTPHETERNLKLIEHLTDKSYFRVRLYPSKIDFAKVSQYKTKGFITISPGSLWFTKQFPEEKWISFLLKLDKDIVVYLLGSPNEKDLCSRIRQESNIMSRSLNLAGKLSFLQSAALMKDALMNYVNDSAPMHLASSVNAPTTAIYCSTVPEFGFGPLSENAVVVQALQPPDCKPCGLHGFKKCPQQHFDCAYNIETHQLLDTL